MTHGTQAAPRVPEIQRVRRADWRHDVHAFECYSCAFKSSPPASTRQCLGCINRHTRPNWLPHPDYEAAAKAAILKAGTTP